jgi:tellurite methyltransferase
LRDGGYEEGYQASSCFWGMHPSSLVTSFLESHDVTGHRILDLGCGEGKNAKAFAGAGSMIDAVDCSARAINNGKLLFGSSLITWHVADATQWILSSSSYHLVMAYGLFHCLTTKDELSALIAHMNACTKANGYNIICTFNDRTHDLAAHPGFKPLLLPHSWYLNNYRHWAIEFETDTILYEAHPHNRLPHHHSMTRMIVRKHA